MMSRSCRMLLLLPLLLSGQAMAATEGATTTINVSGSLVDAPECTVNGNNQIRVDFGNDVVIGRIDGTSYKKTALAYSLVCTSPLKSAMKVTINTTTPATWGTGLIQTTKTGLGLRLYNGENILPTGTAVNFTYSVGGALPALYAVPIAQSGATLTQGTFVATGTMVIAYQ